MTANALKSAHEPTERTVLWQIAVGLGLLLLWEGASRVYGVNWISSPSLVAVKLWVWIQGSLLEHIATTFIEMSVGLVIGTALGASAGMLLGRSPTASTIMRPLVVALYSVPLVALAPLLIMFFGLDLTPKIILVSVVVFFLLLFNTMTGAESVDRDLISGLRLMGSNRREEFQKVVLPGCIAWIVNGVKIALPYSLVAAVTGEMLGARRGLGFLLSHASSQFDMTGIYATLLILMLMGLLVSEIAVRLEQWLLRWRNVSV